MLRQHAKFVGNRHFFSAANAILLSIVAGTISFNIGSKVIKTTARLIKLQSMIFKKKYFKLERVTTRTSVISSFHNAY